jgi:hypothetical protein
MLLEMLADILYRVSCIRLRSKVLQRDLTHACGVKSKDFIQVQRKRVRLSTQRSYVQINRTRLLNYPDARIRKLAARLPGDDWWHGLRTRGYVDDR